MARADANVQNAKGITALMLAAEKGDPAYTKELLARNADVLDHDDLGATALHIAAQGNNIPVARLLLKKSAKLINMQDIDGWTPLMNAAYWNQLDMVKLLIKHHADTQIKSKEGKTALHLAQEKHHKKIIAYLKKHQ